MIKQHTSTPQGISSKGQKIIAALFLVTSHLPEHDPLRSAIREHAVRFAGCTLPERRALAATITDLLEAAILAQLVSERNVRIIEAEMKYFADPLYLADPAIATLFPTLPEDKGQVFSKRTDERVMSFNSNHLNTVSEKNVVTSSISKESKTKRQERILAYIQDRKSANIKDIATLFPEVSEKTIQRELGALVLEGKIAKRGNKRWSLYLAL